ncbi:MAG: hypothetical protein ABSD73_00500 [Candidatus Bathyarchaeia archaeon]|jgi:Holliday junction resolvase-like predicted endonuclease
MTKGANDGTWKVNVSNEFGSIGEKVAREYLKQNGYEVHLFRDIMFKLDFYMHRKKSEKFDKFFSDFFGGKLEDMEAYIEAIRKLAREEAETRLASHYSRVGIAPDFVVKKDGDLFFIEVKVNQSEPKKYQKASFQIAQKLGFKTLTLRLNVAINIQNDIHITESQ